MLTSDNYRKDVTMKYLLSMTLFLAILGPCRAGGHGILKSIQDPFMEQDAIRRLERRRHYIELASRIPLAWKRQGKGAVTTTNPNDVAALKALYAATNGPYWNNSTRWMSGDPCGDQWMGLYCDQDGYVLDIVLVYNNLSGQVPKELALAKRLEQLILYDNAISSVAPEVYSMPSLQDLDISFNHIAGQLPATVSLPNIQHFALGSNVFKGALPSTWNTPKLRELDLSSNGFTGKLPLSLGKVVTLNTLYLSFNDLSGDYPEEWGSLSALNLLWLFSNKGLTGPFPSSWSGMTSLEDVELEQMTGSIPEYFGDAWKQLKVAKIVRGSLTGMLPKSICRLRKLQYLWLFENKLSGPIPSCIGDASLLVDLELSTNSFMGSIPSSLGSARSLQQIRLDGNQLTGVIPESLGNLMNLTELQLSNNNLTGPIPESFGNLRNLQYFDISNCHLTGSIPSFVGSLTNLQIINLCQNYLTGCVPSTLNALTDLAEFSICYNTISCVDSGLETFFDRIQHYGCFMYDNPWSCPLSTAVPKSCQADCSPCNSGEGHDQCSTCVGSSKAQCGWCSNADVSNCLEGDSQGPDTGYYCPPGDWYFGQGSC